MIELFSDDIENKYMMEEFKKLAVDSSKIEIDIAINEAFLSKDNFERYPTLFLERIKHQARCFIRNNFVNNLFEGILYSDNEKEDILIFAIEKTKDSLKDSSVSKRFHKSLLTDFDLGCSDAVSEGYRILHDSDFEVSLSESDTLRIARLAKVRDVVDVNAMTFKEKNALKYVFCSSFGKEYYLSNKRIEATALYQSYKLSTLRQVDAQKDIVQLLNDMDPAIYKSICNELLNLSSIRSITSAVRREVKSIMDVCFIQRRREFDTTDIDMSLYVSKMSKFLKGRFAVTEYDGLYFYSDDGVTYPIEDAPLHARSLLLLNFLVYLQLCKGDKVYVEEVFTGNFSHEEKMDFELFINELEKIGITVKCVE